MEGVTLAENVELGGAIGADAHVGFEGAQSFENPFVASVEEDLDPAASVLSLDELWVES
jgi:hypothetical protein